MRLGDIKAKQAVFQAVDPVYGEPIEDVKITFKPRSDVEAYEKFSLKVASGGLDTAQDIAETFFEILEDGIIGDEWMFTPQGFQGLLEDENSAFIGNQLVEFFMEKSNFFTVPPPVVEEEQPAKPRKKKK
jgi:hypothetical protein